METIWDYLKDRGFTVEPRNEKRTVHLVLEHEKLNPTQRSRMKSRGVFMEKLDGVYSLVTRVGGEVRHWGRSGKALQNTEDLDVEIEKDYFNINPEANVVFISEVTSDDPLAKLSGHLTPARVNDTDFTPTNMKDNFHDILMLSEFIEGESKMPFMYRLQFLSEAMVGSRTKRIPYLFMSYGNALRLSKSYFKEGKEGGVYSQLMSPWIAGKRDESKIKFKEKLSFDVTVVGVCSGKRGSKYEHTLGKLIVAFRPFGATSGKFIEIPISGMSDAERLEWWNNPSDILLKTIKMDAKSYTETGNLREPRYKEIRHDKSSDFPVELIGEGLEEFVKGQALHRILRWQGSVSKI